MFFLLPLQAKGRCKSYPNSVTLTACRGSIMIILPVIAISMWLRKKQNKNLTRMVLPSKTVLFAL